MKRIAISLLLALLLMAAATQALCDMPELRGYDASQKNKYLYVTFGTYFSDGYGTISPVLWKVLGKGVPAADDVSTEGTDENDNTKKRANEDTYTPETEDVYCLMTEYIIDFHRYNDVRDTRDGEPLVYKNSEMYRFLNETSRERDENGKPIGVLGWLFTPNEIDTLVYMPERGYISLPSRKGELFRRDYGFINEDFREWLPRQATGTYYAFDQGLKYIVDIWSWYYTTDRRRVGFRWIVGDNGHTSVAGAEREGGVRLVCYPHMNQLECLGGSGTKDDPYRLVTMADYVNTLRQETMAAAHTALSAQAQRNAHAVSRAQAEAVAREEEAARIAAQQKAAEEARIAKLKADADAGQATAKRSLERSQLYTQRLLDETREMMEQLRLAPAENADEAFSAQFEASPSGITFYPADAPAAPAD